MLKSELRADEYREKASRAAFHAESCGLPRVREKHETAACAWLDLARMEDQRSAEARRLTANAPARRTAPRRLRPDELQIGFYNPAMPGSRADDVQLSFVVSAKR